MKKVEGRILFISPHFMGYEQAIKSALEARGFGVDFYDDRPSNGFWGKAIIRTNKKFYAYQINRYYENIWLQIKDRKYAYFLALTIEAMPLWFLKRLKDRLTSTVFLFYTWDSVRNKKDTLVYLNYFNRAFSFDKEDCCNDVRLTFLPLFYMNSYAQIREQENYKYDFCFIGTAHSDRYSLLCSLKKLIAGLGRTSFWYMYLQSRKLYVLYKITNSGFKNARMSEFHYEPLSNKDILHIIEQSRIVIDIQHPKQTGLTMRTIEMLGAKRKLITTNADVKLYDFYRPENISVIDRKSPKLDEVFLKSNYVSIDEGIYRKYSIDNWLDNVFGI